MRRPRVKTREAHIEEHLDDPALDPESVVAALHVSVRTLHRLFAHQDLTVAARIKDIARRFDVSAATLGREFARRYGETPRGWRRRHQQP